MNMLPYVAEDTSVIKIKGLILDYLEQPSIITRAIKKGWGASEEHASQEESSTQMQKDFRKTSSPLTQRNYRYNLLETGGGRGVEGRKHRNLKKEIIG